MAKSRVITVKDDTAKFMRQIRKAGGIGVKVGIQGSDAVTDRDGITMVTLGAVHEFGSKDGTIPQRSFLRSTYDENERKYIAKLKSLATASLRKSRNPALAFRVVGEVIRSDVINKIRGKIPPPNAPSTVAHKGSDTPLVDTGALLRSITVEVTKT